LRSDGLPQHSAAGRFKFCRQGVPLADASRLSLLLRAQQQAPLAPLRLREDTRRPSINSGGRKQSDKERHWGALTVAGVLGRSGSLSQGY
jgi:hypothetical protein